MNISCSAKNNACPVLLSSACVFYEGENLLYIGVNMNDNLQTALEKINDAFSTNISSLSVISPLQTTGGLNPTLSILQSSSSSNGYLSSTDWTIFNNKQNIVTLTTTGSSGASTFDSLTGALNVPDYSGAFSGFVPTSRTLTISGTTYDLSADRSWTIDTLYTANGSLTGNRTVTMGTFTLGFEKDITVNSLTVGRGLGGFVNNTVLGSQAGASFTTAQTNVAIGEQALKVHTTGNANTAVGRYAMAQDVDGIGNTALGTSALVYLSSGVNTGNTAIGVNGLGRLTTGSYNTWLGYTSAPGGVLTSGSYNTIIGAQVNVGVASLSNNIILADGQGNIRFRDNATSTILSRLAGIGTRMVVAGVNGELSTQAITVGTVTSIATSGPITGGTITSSGTIGITQSSASTDGYLSSTDWSTFSGKQNQLNGTGFIKASGTTISYDNSTYTPTSRTLTINGVAFDLSANRAWTIASGVTSVGLSMPSAFSVASSPITSSGTIAVTGAGTTGQYIDGSGALQTFPTIPSISGLVPYTGATGSVNLGANNFSANNVFTGFSTITASGTQVVLTINSVPEFQVTGSGGQTIKLPDATTLANGTTYRFNNNQSSGAILVNNNSNTLVASIPSGAYVDIVLLSNSIAAGSWDRHDLAPANVSWSTNTFDYAGSITSATWNGNAVAVNRGGTGATTAGGALTNLGAVGTTRNINTSLPLTGGGDLSADRTISIPAATTSVNGYLTSTDWNTFNSKQAALTLTTTGTSGAATLVGSTLNIPQYSGGGGSMAIGGAITSATAGSVLFAGASGVLAQNNANLFWDNTNARLGIGTTSPATPLHIIGGSGTIYDVNEEVSFQMKSSASKTSVFQMENTTSCKTVQIRVSTSGLLDFTLRTTGVTGGVTMYRTNGAKTFYEGQLLVGTSIGLNNVGLEMEHLSGVTYLTSINRNTVTWLPMVVRGSYVELAATGTTFLKGFSTGNVVIQNGGTFTDAGYRLDVNGTARVSGDALVNGFTIGKGGGNIITNSAFGIDALLSNTSGTSNSAVGQLALKFNTTGTQNMAFGRAALNANTTGSNNMAIGAESLFSNISGSNNVAVGSVTLRTNTGDNNVAVGGASLYNNTTGVDNIGIGYRSMFFSTTASQNLSIGSNALRLTTGGNNNSIGFESMYSNDAGANNNAYGVQALYFNTTGSNNITFGYRSLFRNTTGSNNVSLGYTAGAYISGGATANAVTDNSIYIGYDARALASGQTNQIVIGYQATGLGSNTTIIGNTSTTLTALYGSVITGGTSASASAQLQADSTTKGFLPPRMTTTQKNAISSPAAGLIVYDSTLNLPSYYNGTAWVNYGFNIYNSNGTLSGNRTVGTATGFKLTFNPNVEVITTTYNPTAGMAGWSSLSGYVTTTIPASTSFSGTGYGFSSLIANNYMTYQGSATFAADTLTGSVLGINNISFTAASSTITMSQGSSIRTYSAGLYQNTTSGSIDGTITYMSGLAVRPIYRASGSSTITVINNYGLLINDQNSYSHATITNRWGVYQEGASDNNYFKGKVVIGSSDTVGASPLNVKGLPTSSAGLSTGDVWNNLGVLMIV